MNRGMLEIGADLEHFKLDHETNDGYMFAPPPPFRWTKRDTWGRSFCGAREEVNVFDRDVGDSDALFNKEGEQY